MDFTKSLDFDQHGDVLLHVGNHSAGQPITFKTCSRALARASPVFDRMLYGDFAESHANAVDSGGAWVVKLPEDKAAPLALLLDIAHGHFNRVPKTLSSDQIYDLAVLTHYYDCTRLLGPWIDPWMGSMQEDVRDSPETMAKVLWTCWEFGKKSAFARVARRMLMEAHGPLAVDEVPFQGLQLPPDIIESIIATRLQTIQALLEVFQRMVENLLVVDEKPRWCRYATWLGPHRCESMILGSMTFCLARDGLWPLPAAEDVQESLVGLYRKLTNLIIHDIGQTTEGPSIDHRECNPSVFLLGEVERIMGDIGNPVTDFHWKHLDNQEKRINP